LGALVRRAQETREDGSGEYVPKDLPVVRPHLPRLLSLSICRFSNSFTAPRALAGALVDPSQEAREDGRGKHVPKDLPVVCPHLLRSFPLLWPPARLEQSVLAVLLAPRVEVVWVVHVLLLSFLATLAFVRPPLLVWLMGTIVERGH
jgi:hypothetical protein